MIEGGRGGGKVIYDGRRLSVCLLNRKERPRAETGKELS